MKLDSRRRLLLAASALAGLAVLPTVHAETSDKPLRLIVPLSAGSTGDTVARMLATHLPKTMGRPVVVENVPGAGGLLGTSQLVRAAKDGNTLVLVASTHVINPSIYQKMPFDAMKDVVPVAVIGGSPGVLLVNPSLPVHNLKELVALAKAKPGTLNYGSSGNGTNIHLLSVMLTNEAGINLTHIPYKGNANFVTDLVGGQVQIGFQSTTAAAPFVKAGTLRPIGISTRTRSRLLPDVPTLAEQGLANYDLGSWMAILAPAGLPAELMSQLNAQVNATLALPEVREWFAAQDFELTPGSLEAAKSFMQAEYVKHTRLVKEAGVVLQ